MHALEYPVVHTLLLPRFLTAVLLFLCPTNTARKDSNGTRTGALHNSARRAAGGPHHGDGPRAKAKPRRASSLSLTAVCFRINLLVPRKKQSVPGGAKARRGRERVMGTPKGGRWTPQGGRATGKGSKSLDVAGLHRTAPRPCRNRKLMSVRRQRAAPSGTS
jgi:hypothetical protein